MKTTISFAVAALIYSASATQVQQMTSLATQAAMADGTLGWCDMNQGQRAAWIKAQENARKEKIATARSIYKAGHNKARADYNKARAEPLAEYKKKRTALIKAALEEAGVTSTRKLPRQERKALKVAIKNERKAYLAATQQARDDMIKTRKALTAEYNNARESATEEMTAAIEAFKKTQEECDAMESSSEEEPSESESEEPVTESESEEPVTESESDDEIVTKPVKVTQECDGSVKRLANEQTANLFEIAKQKTGVYQDVSFPADNTSLWWDKAAAGRIRAGWKTRNFNWKRAFEINSNNPGTLWGSRGILPAGVRQGGLGDCWWVAVASSLAEWPERIEKIFKNYDQDKGIYEFEMWSAGQPTKVVVDDRLPLNGNHPQMARQSMYGAWWLPLLEKAAAKYWGRYEHINGGNGGEAYQQLTGYPQTRYNRFKDMTEQQILEVIKMADDNHHVMYGGANGPNDVGMVRAHLYSVLGHTNWDGIDFVQWRNPWGSGEWHGKWSDKDKTTDAGKLAAFRAHVKKLGHDSELTNDGKFWMELADVKKWIGGVEVGYYLDDFHLTSLNRDIKKDNNVYTFTLNNPVTQRVFIQSDAVEIRQMMDRTAPCNEIFRKYQQPKAWIVVDNEQHRINNHPIFGGFKEFKALPAGEYKIEASNGRGDGEVFNMNINVHADKQAVTMA